MKLTIKIKFIIGMSLLIIAIFSMSGYYLLDQKTKELTYDTYEKARNYAKLTVARIGTDYKHYKDSGFIIRSKNVKANLELNRDITKIRIIDYNGKLVYDSETERDEQIMEERTIEDLELIDRVKDVRPSVKTIKKSRIVYLELANSAAGEAQDLSGEAIDPIDNTERIYDLVFPFLESTGQHEYSIQYFLTYKNLDQRIQNTRNSIFVLVGIAIAISIIFAINLASQIVKPLKKLTKGVRIVAKGDLSHRIEVKTKDELKDLADAFNKMAQELDHSIKELVDKQRMAKELEIASKIQKELLPTRIPHLPGLEVAAHTTPAGEVGGDSFDFLNIGQDKVLFYIGDVTGHGVPAGLVMAIANSLIFSFSQIYDNTRDIIVNTNKILTPKTSKNLFMTMCMMMWNIATQKLTYTGGGHEAIMRFSGVTGECDEIKTGGMILGTLPDISMLAKENEIPLSPGDLLVMYTDGITEAYAEDGKSMFGRERLVTSIKKYARSPKILDVFTGIMQDVRTFMGNYPQQDDITLILIRKK